MPDISMCMNYACKKRMKCFRYRAKPSEFRQSYGGFNEKDCEYFWDLKHATVDLRPEVDLK